MPADKKWFARLVVAAAVVDAMEELNLEYPRVSDTQKTELAAARKLLENE